MQWGLLVEFSCNSHCKIVNYELYWSKWITSAVLASGNYNMNNILESSTWRPSQCELYTTERNSYISLPMLSRSLMLLRSALTDLALIYLPILWRNSLIFLILDTKCSIDLCRETAWNSSSHDLGSRAWLIL